jgi:glucose/mannose-6-phosphate isomerase
VIDLDDAEAIRAADPGGMLAFVAGLPQQLRDGYEAGRSTAGLPAVDDVSAIVFCGMGGSAFPGDAVRGIFRGRLGIPFEVVRGPQLPAHAGRGTLVLCSSYSGETAETLACFDEAVRRGCRVVAVSSGGRLASSAARHGIAVVSIPGGYMPRAAVGHLSSGVMGVLAAGALGILPSLDGDVREAASIVEGLARRLGPDAPLEENLAKLLAARMRGRVPVIWGAQGIASVAAARWKTELNENAKVPAFASALPELDHNEVVGWSAGEGEAFFLVALRTREEHAEVARRFPASIDIARSSGAEVQQVEAAGRTQLAELFSLVMTGDFVSCYLGMIRGFDPTPIEAIELLKRKLAQG